MKIAPTASCRVLCFSDTYGVESGNGVGRFLHDLRIRSNEDATRLRLIVPGRHEGEPDLTAIRAPSFHVPGYGNLQVATLLEHHRKTIERQLKSETPDCVHVSTPGPFGLFGWTMARRYRLPLVGIYHTDFPSYAREIALNQLTRAKDNPLLYFGPTLSRVLPIVWPYYEKLKQNNPQVDDDLQQLGEIVVRNASALTGDAPHADKIGRVAEVAMLRLMQHFYSRFTFVVARSEQQRSELAETLKLDPDRIRCLCPGTDTERFSPRFRDRSVWREFGVPEDAFVALYVGRVTSEKNIGLLLESWRRLQADAAGEKMHLVIVGEGEPGDLSMAGREKQVHTIGPHRGQQLSTLYASADLLMFPSITETLGQVGLEAGASGLPVLVSDRGGQQMYVKHAETGYILPADDPNAWAEHAIRLAADEGHLAKQFGVRACQHVADHYTLQHSLDSYWEIHQEAVERAKRDRAVRPKTRRIATVPESLANTVPKRGVMFISDYHAGRRFGSPAERIQKRAAIRRMLSKAIEEELEVVFGGDFGDHGARFSRLEADFKMFREVRRGLGFDGEPLFLRGNHDYGFSDEQLMEYTGGCRIHHSLVYYHPQAAVTLTHGHILALGKTREVVGNAANTQDLVDQLQEDRLDEDLKPSVIAYDLANLIESTLAKQGLTGLNTFWESFYQSRAQFAERLLRVSEQTNHADEATWKMIAGIVGTHDNVQVAGLLGARCGGWASLFGHTHEPLARRTRVTLTEGGPKLHADRGQLGEPESKTPDLCGGAFSRVGDLQVRCKK